MKIINNESKKRKIFSEDEKMFICLEVKTLADMGVGIMGAMTEVAKKHGISLKMIQRWDMKFRIFSSEQRNWTIDEKVEICNTVKILMDMNKCSARHVIDYLYKTKGNKLPAIESIYRFNRELGGIFSVKDKVTDVPMNLSIKKNNCR